MQITISHENYINLFSKITHIHSDIEHVLDKHDLFNVDTLIEAPRVQVYNELSKVIYFLNTRYDTRDIVNLNNRLTREAVSYCAIILVKEDKSLIENIILDLSLFEYMIFLKRYLEAVNKNKKE